MTMSAQMGRKQFLGLGAAAVAVGAVAATPGRAYAIDDDTWRNVKHFGATGNGTTNDAPAIQAAINQASPQDAIFFPPGTYRCDSTITSAGRSLSIIGSGIGVSKVIFTGAGHGFDFTFDGDDPTLNYDYFNVRDISVFTRNASAQTAIRARWTSAQPTGQYPHCNIKDVEIDRDLSGTVGNWATGIHLQDAWKAVIDTVNYRSPSRTGIGIDLQGRCVDSLITNPHLSNVRIGIQIGPINEGTVIYNPVVVGGLAGVQTQVGLNGIKGPWVTVRDGHFNTAQVGVDLRGTGDCWVTDNLIYKEYGTSDAWWGIRVVGCRHSRITGNECYDTSGLAPNEVGIEIRDSNLITVMNNEVVSCRQGIEIHNSVACIVSHNLGRGAGTDRGAFVYLAPTSRGCAAHSNLSQMDSGTAPAPAQNLGTNNHVADNHSHVGGLA
jgi:parallel beta-helix repeat protein